MKGTEATIDADLWIQDDANIRVEGMHPSWTTLRFDTVRLTMFTTPATIKRLVGVLLTALEENQDKEEETDS